MTATADSGPTRFALIIGAMKAGTTSLFEYLAHHPAVAPSRPKEPNFFTDPAWRADGPHRGLAEYQRLWDWDPAVHTVALEASTSYTMLPQHQGVATRVKSLTDGEFRLIYIMRDPVDRLVSHLSHLATRRGARPGHEQDFETAVQVSSYATQLEPWADAFGRDRILTLVYERMVADPDAVLGDAHGFLGLPPEPLAAELGEARNTRSDLAADQLLSRLVARAPWLEGIRRYVPGPAVRAVRAFAGRVGAVSVTLTERQRAEAVERLEPEVRRVAAEWGVDPSSWRSFS